MIFRLFNKYSLGTVNRPTMLQSLRSYKNSAAKNHLSDYIRNDQALQKYKKQKIDYEFITKQSNGNLMFRQFLFQQKTQQTLVPHLNCQIQPSGAWTFQQIKKQLGHIQQNSKTQVQNKQILDECQKDIIKAFQQYYTNLGKKKYKFNLSEQINKINQMTEQEFKNFSNILFNRK